MEICHSDLGVQREDALGAIAAFVCGCFQERDHGCVELERHRFDVVA